MINLKSSLAHCLILVIVCFFAFFLNNYIIPADLMESRNLATAQEMVSTGNYLIPTMNGELRLEKPPLPTWIAAGVENIIPDNLVAQRCMAGLAATLLVFFLYLIVSYLTLNRQTGLVCALVLASCYNVIMMGRTATWDIYCHSFMLGGIYFFITAIDKKGKQWMRFIITGILFGLSFLSKGPISFYGLLLPFLICYFISFRPSLKDKYIPLVLMVVCSLIVSFWWPVYTMLFHKEEFLSVVKKESTSWTDRSVKPFYYYWLQFYGEAGVWALFWLTSLLSFLWKKKREYSKVYLFSVIWTVFILIFLSVIPEKKPRYLLPLLIPGAMNVGLYFYYIATNKLTRVEQTVFKINAAILALIIAAIPITLYIMFVRDGMLSIPLFISIAVLSKALSLFIILSAFNKRKIKVWHVFSVVVVTMIMIESLCLAPIATIFINQDRYSIRLLKENEKVKDLLFYYDENEFLRMELVYEANRIIRPLNLEDDELFYEKLPFVFISSKPTEEVLEGKNVRIEYIDTFDNNWQKPSNRKYNKNLVKHVSIIYPE